MLPRKLKVNHFLDVLLTHWKFPKFLTLKTVKPSLFDNFGFPTLHFAWSFDSIFRSKNIFLHCLETLKHCATQEMSTYCIICSNINVGTKLIISVFSSIFLSVNSSIYNTFFLMSFSVKGRRKALLTYITNKLLFLLYLKKSKSHCIKTFIGILALQVLDLYWKNKIWTDFPPASH